MNTSLPKIAITILLSVLITIFEPFVVEKLYTPQKFNSTIEIKTNLPMTVYINGKNKGKAPEEINNVMPGNNDISLYYSGKSVFNGEIPAETSSPNTVIQWVASTNQKSYGYVIYYKKNNTGQESVNLSSNINSSLVLDNANTFYGKSISKILQPGMHKFIINSKSINITSINFQIIKGYNTYIQLI